MPKKFTAEEAQTNPVRQKVNELITEFEEFKAEVETDIDLILKALDELTPKVPSPKKEEEKKTISYQPPRSNREYMPWRPVGDGEKLWMPANDEATERAWGSFAIKADAVPEEAKEDWYQSHINPHNESTDN